MVKCPKCSRRINSIYIREGEKGLWKKIGYFCMICDIHYDMKLKPYIKGKISSAKRVRMMKLNAV